MSLWISGTLCFVISFDIGLAVSTATNSKGASIVGTVNKEGKGEGDEDEENEVEDDPDDDDEDDDGDDDN